METADWNIFGDYFWEHFVFSFTTLLSRMLRVVGSSKKKQAAYFEANYYQMTLLQNIS